MLRFPRARMLRWTLACVAWLAACGDDADAAPNGDAGSDAGGPAAGELTLLTYNVAGLPEALSGSEPTVNTPLISPLLDDYDLVLVQEDWLEPEDNPFAGVFETYHDLLAAEAHHPYQSEPAPQPFGMDPSRPTAQLADGLNRFSNSPFADLVRVSWPGCFGGIDQSDGGAGDCLAFKGFSMAVHSLAEGVQVHVYNLHGEAGGTAEDQRLSEEGFALLADYIVEHSNGAAVLLGGDTNLHTSDGHPDGMGDADQRIWDSFRATTGLSDVCEVVEPCEVQIDKVAFRDSEALHIEPTDARFEREKFARPSDGVPLSDHEPLAVRLRWRADR
jgi:hypothetical protein